eukprot:ctg_5329.g666
MHPRRSGGAARSATLSDDAVAGMQLPELVPVSEEWLRPHPLLDAVDARLESAGEETKAGDEYEVEFLEKVQHGEDLLGGAEDGGGGGVPTSPPRRPPEDAWNGDRGGPAWPERATGLSPPQANALADEVNELRIGASNKALERRASLRRRVLAATSAAREAGGGGDSPADGGHAAFFVGAADAGGRADARGQPLVPLVGCGRRRDGAECHAAAIHGCRCRRRSGAQRAGVFQPGASADHIAATAPGPQLPSPPPPMPSPAGGHVSVDALFASARGP